jgi:putative redox protein
MESAGIGAPRGRHQRLRTACGREMTTGRLALGDAGHPLARVFLDLGNCPGCEGNHWASLTVLEARLLAAALLIQAAAAERDCRATSGR